MLRRDAIRLLAAGSASAAFAAESLELRIAAVSPSTIRITVAQPGARIPGDGSILGTVLAIEGKPVRDLSRPHTLSVAGLKLVVQPEPLTIRAMRGTALIQEFSLDAATGTLAFQTTGGPILGLGEGGPQFDRRGSFDEMKNGQGGYRERTHGARIPIPWIIGAAGWAIFIHHPYGKFDFTAKERALFLPAHPTRTFPLDLFLTVAAEPAAIMTEYARLTGFPDLPPLWSFGYQQSHRTLAGPGEVLAIAKTFREKKLPCDVLIYLGTGFCPSGWNTGHGSFTFNSPAFPPEIIARLRDERFRVVLHTVFREPELRGSVSDRCRSRDDRREAACYWQMHREVFGLGVDGWWPDEGDQLDAASRLCRNRLYYEGPLVDRPGIRPYALHRNGYAGTQRFGAFVWSGDVSSTWETLRTHVPVAINTSLSGLPFWGTDTGGFVPTKELTGELYVRWFQFSAFCPLFRSHGRTWKLRLPWQWNTGDMGPSELGSSGANPDPAELHNAAVEPICRKYLELRYRLMPYLYSAVRECYDTGMPILRALWMHYPDDPAAVARGDEYLWGRDVLVAPVVEKGAAARRLYLPRGVWYDFWTQEELEGGREIVRPVDLATMPLYVRAGAILPLGPVKQYTSEHVEGPLTLWIYPGASGEFTLYEDDGASFKYRQGEWMGLRATWDDRRRLLTLRLAEHSRMLPPLRRDIEIRVASSPAMRAVVFDGRPLEVRLQ